MIAVAMREFRVVNQHAVGGVIPARHGRRSAHQESHRGIVIGVRDAHQLIAFGLVLAGTSPRTPLSKAGRCEIPRHALPLEIAAADPGSRRRTKMLGWMPSGSR